MSFKEVILDFQSNYLTKLESRHSFKSLKTFTMIRDDMNLCHCTGSSWSNTNPCHLSLGIHYLFQLLLSKKNLHEPFQTIMLLQTVMFQALTSLSSWYMLFQEPAIIADSEFANHACKSHTVSAEVSPYLLVSNTWFGYRL